MILVTGGAGFVGSHVCLALLQAGHSVVVLDNFCNSDPRTLDRVGRLAGIAEGQAAGEALLSVVKGDVCDPATLAALFTQYRPRAVVHLAGLKSVAESVRDPARYLTNNVDGVRAVLAACREAGVRKLVFSSSATVYGAACESPIPETAPCAPANPYGQSKWLGEQELRAAAASGAPFARSVEGAWSIALLRYFNAAGAHPSGSLGEAPRGAPANLFAILADAALLSRPKVQVFGTAYDTRDGTCERDYVHVQDLAEAHLAALDWLDHNPGCHVFNLGSGQGHTVHEVVLAFAEALGRPFDVVSAPARPGDLPRYFADVSRARAAFGWTARRSLPQMAQDALRWRQSHPLGYAIIEPLKVREQQE